MSDINTATNLLSQIIEEQEKIDAINNKKALEEHKGLKACGESFILFYLRQLKEILDNESKKLENTLQSNK